jgi:hypothetical protein
MKDPIKVVIKKPGKEPEIAVIPNELKSLQKIVGGYIESVSLLNGVVMLVNESGKLLGLDENFIIRRPFADVIVGTAVFLGEDGEDFDDFPFEKYKDLEEVIDYDRA